VVPVAGGHPACATPVLACPADSAFAADPGRHGLKSATDSSHFSRVESFAVRAARHRLSCTVACGSVPGTYVVDLSRRVCRGDFISLLVNRCSVYGHPACMVSPRWRTRRFLSLCCERLKSATSTLTMFAATSALVWNPHIYLGSSTGKPIHATLASRRNLSRLWGVRCFVSWLRRTMLAAVHRPRD